MIEIRAIHKPEVRRFWTDRLDSLRPTLQSLNVDRFDIFYGVNPRSYKGSNEASVGSVLAFYADVDDYGGIRRPTPQMKGVPKPSLVIDSGHGRHLYWNLGQPVAVTDLNRDSLKAINRGMALAVGGDPACCDLSRLLRLPGYINHKPPAAEVKVLEENAARYTLSDLEPFAVAAKTVSGAVASLDNAPPLTDEVKERFLSAARKNRDLRFAWRGEIGDGSSDSRFVLVGGLLQLGFSPTEIAAMAAEQPVIL